MSSFRIAFLLPCCAVALASCAGGGGIPSLAPRAVEYDAAEGRPPPPCLRGAGGTSVIASPATTPVAIIDDKALGGRIAALLTDARAGQDAFAALVPQAEKSAAHAGASGSDSWIAAQRDVSRLAAAKTRTGDALAGLDALAVARSDVPTSDSDSAALGQAIAEAQGLADAQEAEIARIDAMLNSP